MARSKSNHAHNYPRVIKYLEDKHIDYWQSDDHQHLKILGPRTQLELWPSRMTYHVIESEVEILSTNRYYRLSFYFNDKELEELL